MDEQEVRLGSASVKGAIHNEVSAAIGTAEWDDWRKREYQAKVEAAAQR